MSTLKEEVMQSFSKLPEDANVDDMMYRLYVVDCIRRGEKDIEDGRTISHEEIRRQIEKWK